MSYNKQTAHYNNAYTSCNIKALNDGEYDYLLEVEADSNFIDNSKDFVKELNEYLVGISNILKFNVGKIKYQVKAIDIKYVDEDKAKELKNSQVYVKHI